MASSSANNLHTIAAAFEAKEFHGGAIPQLALTRHRRFYDNVKLAVSTSAADIIAAAKH